MMDQLMRLSFLSHPPDSNKKMIDIRFLFVDIKSPYPAFLTRHDMSVFSFLFLLLIASITGAIGARIAGRRNLGCLASIVLGFIGALIGTFIAREFNLPLFPWIKFGSQPFPVIWAILGAALFVAFLNLFTRSRQ